MSCGGGIDKHDLVSNEITRYADKKIFKAEYFVIQSHSSIAALVTT